jgi:hypothetical protein
VIKLGKERRRYPRDEVLEAVDSLLVVLRENSQRNQAATRHAQTIRRLRSHGRRYSEILGSNPVAADLRVTLESVEATVHACERLGRAEVRALHDEGLGTDRISVLCGLTQQQVEAVIGEGAA